MSQGRVEEDRVEYRLDMLEAENKKLQAQVQVLSSICAAYFRAFQGANVTMTMDGKRIETFREMWSMLQDYHQQQ